MSGDIGCNYMLHHLAQYACQWDGPVIGRVCFIPLFIEGTYLSLGPFHSEGNWPVLSDFSNSRQTTGAISNLNSFNIMGLIKSGPAALLGLIFAKSLTIPLGSIKISGIGGHKDCKFSGIFSWNNFWIIWALNCPSGDKREKTDWNCWLRRFAFSTLSLCNVLFSLSFKVDMPPEPCLLFLISENTCFV